MLSSNAPECTKMHHSGESSQRATECPKMSENVGSWPTLSTRQSRLMKDRIVIFTLALITFAALAARAAELAGFSRSAYFDEQVREQLLDDVRIVFNAPAATAFDPSRPTLLIFYALPNGNTIEQTIGCRMADGVDWHFDIQH